MKHWPALVQGKGLQEFGDIARPREFWIAKVRQISIDRIICFEGGSDGVSAFVVSSDRDGDGGREE